MACGKAAFSAGNPVSVLPKAALVGRSVAISVVGSVRAGRAAGGKPAYCDGEQSLIRSDQSSCGRGWAAVVAGRGVGMAARLAAASWALFVPRGRFVEGLAALFGAAHALVPLLGPSSLCFRPNVHPLGLSRLQVFRVLVSQYRQYH